MQINIEVFYKFLLSFRVCLTGHTQNSAYKKFFIRSISLQYLPKNMVDEVDFLPVDKYESFLQVDSITLDVCSQACPNYPK